MFLRDEPWYDEAELEQAMRIARMRAAGFSLQEIRKLLGHVVERQFGMGREREVEVTSDSVTAEERLMLLAEERLESGRARTMTEALTWAAGKFPAVYQESQLEGIRGTEPWKRKRVLLSERAAAKKVGPEREIESRAATISLSEKVPLHQGRARAIAELALADGRKPTWRHISVRGSSGPITDPRGWTQALYDWKMGLPTAAGFTMEYAGAPVSPSEVDWTGSGRDQFTQQLWRLGIQAPDPGVPTRMSEGPSAYTRFMAACSAVMRDKKKTFTEAADIVAEEQPTLYAEYREAHK